MDQPGRCRRTDGKRWRCSKDAIPNEKYCQKHMHRGCRRSRKLVESPIADLNTPMNVDPKMQPSGDAATNSTTSNAGAKKNLKIEDSLEDPSGRMTKITYIPASKMEGKQEKQVLPSVGGKPDKSSSVKAEGGERLKTENSNKGHTVSLDFSPKSVLGQGELVEETKRCRRTDGKMWRCSKEVIGEDQKYCASHMYRGAKKRPQEGECNPFALVRQTHAGI